MSKRGSYIGGGSVIYPSRGNPESFPDDPRAAPTWQAIQARKEEWAREEMKARRQHNSRRKTKKKVTEGENP
jgi:hypothetical protein